MSEYRKLSKIKSIGGSSTIWKSEDHFLISKTRGYFIEEYRRYFFRDIQYIAVCKTRKASVIYSILSIVALLALAGALLSYMFEEKEIASVSGILAVILTAILSYCLLANGRSCIVIIKTAAGNNKEAFSGYYSRTIKVIELLSLEIQQMQAEMAEGGTEKISNIQSSMINDEVQK